MNLRDYMVRFGSNLGGHKVSKSEEAIFKIKDP